MTVFALLTVLPLFLAVLAWQWDPGRGLRERWRQWRSKRMRAEIKDIFETDEAVDLFRSMRADLQTGEQK